MEINIAVNSVYLPYLDKPQRTQIYYGGSSSGKSFFLCQKILLDTLNGVNWLCCRNVGRMIRESIYNEIRKAIDRMGLEKQFRVNESDMRITCLLNGSQILFHGLDDPEKIKSISPRKGVLERVFIEEATEITYDAFKQLRKRLRGPSKHPKCVILAFNPILKTHWIYKEFFGAWRDDSNVLETRDLLILKTTYRDNIFLTEEDRRELEDETDPYYRAVYTDGNWGVLGSVIFKNWRVEDLSSQIPHFDNIYNGMDFGYSADPNALIRVHVDRMRKKLYVFDELYRAGMSDDDLYRAVDRMIGRAFVTCDSAEPKTIDYLAGRGIRATPAVKGADSIKRGIRWLQGYEIIIDARCQNFKNEIEQYHWITDKYGNVTDKPVDRDNHLIDALRYATESLQTEAGMRTVNKRGL